MAPGGVHTAPVAGLTSYRRESLRRVEHDPDGKFCDGRMGEALSTKGPLQGSGGTDPGKALRGRHGMSREANQLGG